MQRAGQLLAILLAAILSMSALASTIIPAATVFPAFAEEHEEEDDDNSGQGSGGDESEDEAEDESEDESEDEAEDEMEDEEDDDNSGSGSGDDEAEDESEDETEDEEDGNSDGTEDEHDEAEDETEDEENDEHEEEMEDEDGKSKTKLKAEDDGIEVEVEKEGLDLDNGLYNVTFSCTDPAVSMAFEDGLEVEDGEGDFEANIALEEGTYSGCEVAVDEPEMTLASFDDFTVTHEEEDEHDEETEEEDEHEVNEHRKDRAEEAEHKVDEIKERILNAEPASPGPVTPGLNYTLTAAGTTDEETAQDATADLELLSWKSTPAIAILAVVGGEVQVGDTDYTVLIGYAIYSLNHDAVRINALAVDEASGDVIKVTLRGSAAEDAEFPDASGESVNLHFEGSSGPQNNKIGGVVVILDGALEAE